eukprot:TRINITY_DN73569_c0_g1_i1.p1 TRINITY_DN73569_c0_g1~~TRINITY_DN73569_c0_g1_i1.p1  ORF type:complete len:474 (+),score=82.03 TRINITY_DN73569_c0_g1_i1:72-1424(+)
MDSVMDAGTVVSVPEYALGTKLGCGAQESTSSSSQPYVVLEHLERGCLHTRVLCRRLKESRALIVARDVLLGIAHLNSLGIVHRDVKPENVAFDKNDVAKLIDFGCACDMNDKGAMAKWYGSPGFAAPEVITKKPYGSNSDVFSVGATLYFSLSREAPFWTESMSLESIREETCRGEINFGGKFFERASSECKDVIRLLLTGDQHHRPSAEQALEHRALASDDNPAATSRNTKRRSSAPPPRALTDMPHRHSRVLSELEVSPLAETSAPSASSGSKTAQPPAPPSRPLVPVAPEPPAQPGIPQPALVGRRVPRLRAPRAASTSMQLPRDANLAPLSFAVEPPAGQGSGRPLGPTRRFFRDPTDAEVERGSLDQPPPETQMAPAGLPGVLAPRKPRHAQTVTSRTFAKRKQRFVGHQADARRIGGDVDPHTDHMMAFWDLQRNSMSDDSSF